MRSPYELYDSIPLTAYRVKGQQILTTKRFISLLDLQLAAALLITTSEGQL